jgi:intracellular multiplication protein IcmL
MVHKYWFTIIFFLLVSQFGLLMASYGQYFFRYQGDFFGQPPEKEAIRLSALERPNISTKALLSWATLAATGTFTFDFVHYNETLESLRDYFTTKGYNNFVDSLTAQGFLTEIVDKKLVLTAVAIGPAIIITEGIQAGVYTWLIEVPVLVRYQSTSTNETRIQDVKLTVTQVSTKEATKGIGIAQYVARSAGSDITE